MAPWPRSGIHPVWAERAQAAGIDYYEYTDAMEDGSEGARPRTRRFIVVMLCSMSCQTCHCFCIL